ncbi:MAG: ribosome recycling factor, partial [Actinobacteria bacterium]|nr:ribosome recycling factor [Actinomycetota bacterium]
MDKAIVATKNEFNTVRSGRASTALLDRIMVDYYGIKTPLKQLANVAVPEPRLLTV